MIVLCKFCVCESLSSSPVGAQTRCSAPRSAASRERRSAAAAEGHSNGGLHETRAEGRFHRVQSNNTK